MGIFDRFIRPRNDSRSEIFLSGGYNNVSGQPVNQKTAMQLTAVYGCVRILSETIAELPLHLYKYENGNKVRAYDHPLYKVLHDLPNDEMTSFTFRELLMSNLCLDGNAYAQIVRNKRGEVIGLYPLLPENVEVRRDENNKIFYTYIVTDDLENGKEDGRLYNLKKDEVLHIPGLGFNGLKGKSPLEMAANAIGSALAADRSAGRYYANAAMPSGVVEYPGTIKDPVTFRERWQKTFAGAINSGKTPILEEGMTYKPISISPQQAQFLETRKFSINEIARIYRVPPHMLADLEKSSFSNIEQQSLEFVKYTIAPWVARWEQSLNKCLLVGDQKNNYFFSFNLEGLLRGDYLTRMQGYQIARNSGWMSANDIRELENMNLIPDEEGGNKYLVNGTMTPLESAGAAYDLGKEITNE